MESEAFFLAGEGAEPPGVLLIHGLTGSPHEMRYLGEALQGRGMSALGVRLPGHGADRDRLDRTTWRHWLAAVERGLADLSESCSSLHLAGFSMGGLLALLVAHRHRSRISSMALMSTPLWLPLHARMPLWLVKLTGLDQGLTWLARATTDTLDDRAIWVGDQDWSVAQLSNAFLLNAVLSLEELMERARAVARRVEIPTLLLHSRHDPVAPYACSTVLLRRLPRARRVTLTRSAHVIPLEAERDLVADQVGDFFEHASDCAALTAR